MRDIFVIFTVAASRRRALSRSIAGYGQWVYVARQPGQIRITTVTVPRHDRPPVEAYTSWHWPLEIQGEDDGQDHGRAGRCGCRPPDLDRRCPDSGGCGIR